MRSRRDYWEGKRARHQPIMVLGHLGWTVREIAQALGVTPPTIYKSMAGVLLYWDRRRGMAVLGNGQPLPVKLRATVAMLAKLEDAPDLLPEDVRVRDALRAVLLQVSCDDP